MSTTRPVYVNNAKMASAANSAAKTKAKPIDTMTTKLARPVSLLSFGRELYASANTPHEFSFEGIPDDEGVLIPGKNLVVIIINMLYSNCCLWSAICS